MPRSKGRSHDRLYITAKEYSGAKPWQDPVCTPDGTVYDLMNIIEWLKKYKTNPRTGEKLSPKDLITLLFHKNTEDKFHCPITFKEFTDHSHIVAVRVKQSAHVYSYEAVSQMNIKAKHWKDLTTGEPFTKDDIITLQDPHDPDRRKADSFWFVVNNVSLEEQKDPVQNMQLSSSAKKALDELKKNEAAEKAKAEEEAKKKAEEDAANGYEEDQEEVENTIGGFTFSGGVKKIVKTKQAKKTTKKGYARIVTTLGNLNLELDCDLVPKTCENFLGLCERGYYRNVVFHRLIKNFMIQGGDPTGTGTGGNSIWNRKFEDEFVPSLKHDEAGVLSMANSGKNTNGSQFFILFRSAKHLDGKHTVFGRVKGGLEVLKAMETVPTDDGDRPKVEIKILDAIVYFNPFNKDEIAKERQEEAAKERERLEREKPEYGQWYSNPGGDDAVKATTPAAKPGGATNSKQVGKYLQLNAPTGAAVPTASGGLSLPAPTSENSKKRPLDFGATSAAKRTKLNNYGNFANF